MSGHLRRIKSLPFGTIILGLLATAAYAVMLSSTINVGASHGEAALGDTFEALFATVGLWIVLAIMLVVGGVMGGMPNWAGWTLIALHPLAGVSTFVAIDMCSRDIGIGIFFVVLLPLLIAFYALWARFPSLRPRLPSLPTSVATLGAIAMFSLLALLMAAEF